jgi:hypothetical protein
VEKGMQTNKHSKINVLQIENEVVQLEYMFKTRLRASLLLNYYSQDLILQIPSLGLNSQKKLSFPYYSLHCCIYEEREIISKTSFTTKEK